MISIKKKILCMALEGTAMVLFLQGVLWLLVVFTVTFTGRIAYDPVATMYIYGFIAFMFLFFSLFAYLGHRVIKDRLSRKSIAS